MLGLREVPGLRVGSRYAIGERESLSRRPNLEWVICRRGLSGALSNELEIEDPSACGSYMD